MSKLSSFLQKKVGISQATQKGIMAVAKPIVAPIAAVAAPIVGAIDVFETARAAASSPSPFTGVVSPGNSPTINQTFGLTPVGSQPVLRSPFTDVKSGSSSTAPTGQRSGYHLNKHALPACKSHGAVPARSILVRNRHRNPANGAAIKRAASRLKAAEKIFRKVLTLRHGAVKGHVVPKGRKR
jgi:hypothetical protein